MSLLPRARKACQLLALLALAGYLVLRALAHPAEPHPFFQATHRPMLFAHQGGEGEWPNNTLLALANSDRLGADVLDLDVHLSRDGQLVLCHDATLDRTTNATGPIRERTAKELKQLDAAYRFTTDQGRTYPYRGKGIGIPTLQEVFERFPKRRFGIEIKTPDPQAVQVLKQLGHEGNILVSSFHDHIMQAVRRETRWATSASPGEVRTFVILSTLHLEALYSPPYNALQVPREHKGKRILSARLVDAAHQRGVEVVPWTLNRPEEIKEAWRLDVDGVNTDYPTRYLMLRAKSPQDADHSKEDR